MCHGECWSQVSPAYRIELIIWWKPNKKFLTKWIVFEYQSTKCFRANAKAQDPPNELTEEDYNNYYGEYEGEYGTDYEEGVDGDYGN